MHGYIDGRNYYILYRILTENYEREYFSGSYDVESVYWIPYNWTNFFTHLKWEKEKRTLSTEVYVQVIDSKGNIDSDMGIPVINNTYTEEETEEIRRKMISYTYQASGSGWWGGGTKEIETLYSYSTNIITGTKGEAAASLIEIGKTILISGQISNSRKINWNNWVSDIIDAALFSVHKNEITRIEFPSWCSGKYGGFCSGHLTSGREGKYLHFMNKTRVWRLKPR